MSKNRARTRAIRARMAQTGESYTAAARALEPSEPIRIAMDEEAHRLGGMIEAEALLNAMQESARVRESR
jgi:hypothetical protein